jgi:hypothetical protein
MIRDFVFCLEQRTGINLQINTNQFYSSISNKIIVQEINKYPLSNVKNYEI